MTNRLPLRNVLPAVSLVVAGLAAIGLAIGAFLPERIIGPWVSNGGWPAHLGGLFCVALLVVVARPRWWPWILAGGTTLGGLVELVQPYFGRGGEWNDFAGDIAGLATGCAVALAIRKLWSCRLKGEPAGRARP